MDENIVFNPPGQDIQQNSSAEVSVQATDQAADVEQPVETEEEVAIEGASPPGFIGGIFGGSLFKKLLIGIGAIILLTFVIILLIPKGQPDKPVTLQWWGLWEDSSTIQPLILNFKKTHPNITIEYIKNDPNQYLDRLQSRMQNGKGPDIFLYHNTWMPMLSGELSPLPSSVITPDQFKQTYYPVMQQGLTQNGALYGIPLDADSLTLFVNPDLFQAAGVQVPTNWDDFVKAAKQLTVKDPNGKIKTAGAALGTYDNIKHAPDIISLLFLQQGVQMSNLTASSQNESGALQFYTSFAKGQNNVWDGTLDNSLLSFSRGTLAMYFGFSWDVFAIQNLNSNLNFSIYPVPNLYGKKTTVASFWVNGVSSKSPNQKEAMEFMQFLAQKSTAQEFYTETAKKRAFGEPYARKDLQQSLRENRLVYPFVSQLDDAGSSFFASDTHDGDTGLNSQMNTYLQTAVNSVVNDSGSADSAVSTLNNGVSQVLQKYGQQ
ncbi:MAG TPA: extracellular solute-binding protein [Candidatus Sulfotelmatobacter sp.]|jgi:multiple sugar transport system substrate-binding protein|nr:extracellular solute-binding protein [Candidatus Sulfotelmatobacter sp.]